MGPYVVLNTLILFSLIWTCTATFCKSTPESSDWPSDEEWNALNSSLSNRLLKPLPPAAACHPNYSVYNSATCAILTAEWATQDFHSLNPVSVGDTFWTNDSCLPDPTAPCSGEGYPIYVVNATSAQDVKLGIDFARKHNIRLVVKGGGHDYLGRSIAPNSLSIWTRHIPANLQFTDSFSPKQCNLAPTSAVTIGAGAWIDDIYAEAKKLNRTPVIGTSPSISLGGYLTGGGHSPLSHWYGLGADQILEMEVVTSFGQILTVNECQNPDLFWAIRGGGGSTFAVVTSFTVKTYPTTPMGYLGVLLGTPEADDNYWESMGYIMTQVPYIVESGLAGYTYVEPSVTLGNVTYAGFAGFFFAPNKTSLDAANILAPLLAQINQTNGGNVTIVPTLKDFDNYYDFWQQVVEDNSTSGTEALLGSRILNKAALSKSPKEWGDTLRSIIPPYGVSNGIMTAGPGVWANKGQNAITPSWRDGYIHYVIAASSPELTPLEKIEYEQAIVEAIQGLEKMAPGSGNYVNEAYAYDPEWPYSFWQDNYPRLLAIKRRWDPKDVFWCYPCVGRERWEEIGDQLCQVKC